jgi:hypothetical protein
MSSSRYILLTLPLLLGCALTMSACGVPLVVTAGGYAADGGLLAATDKTSTDHLASIVTKKDCAFFRMFRGSKVCRERDGDHDPYDVSYDEAERMPSEDGVQYGPPLRPASDAPAASWDAAAYKPAEPAPAPAKPEPATAVADAAPASAPAAVAPAAAPKPKKGRSARSARKPSRGQVAPAP